jgi:PAS domain S-box-containing protein
MEASRQRTGVPDVPERSDAAELDALLSAAVDAIVVADASGRILRANAAAYLLFGFEEGELPGQSVNVLMPESEARRHDGYMHHHLATGDRRIIGKGRELEGRRKDGTLFPMHLSIGRSETPSGPVFVAILHDLTRRRAAQLALERSQRLGAIGEMTGGIAHDFNNILTLVIGNLELASHRDVTPEVRSLLEDALEAAELGAQLTARLLAFARQSRLVPERLGTTEAVERAVTLFRRSLKPGHRLDLALSPEAGDIDVDGPQFQSALLNLLRNAEDAMAGDGVILVTTEPVDVDETYLAQEIDVRPGRYVRISVSDTGTGMTEEARRRAFEPFFTTKAPGKGTGLGLATTYGFVRQSGGHLTLYSEPKQGTTVSIYLPLASPEAREPASMPAQVETPLPGSGEVVLVVEDDAAVRRMTADRLTALGYATVVVSGAEAALSVLAQGRHVDLVFTDMMMPDGRTGLELAREVRSIRPDLPILMTTGYAGEMIDVELIDGLPLIRKPYRQEELSRAIRRALASRQAVTE